MVKHGSTTEQGLLVKLLAAHNQIGIEKVVRLLISGEHFFGC